MDIVIKRQLVEHLSQFITPSRREKIDSALQQRTRYVVPVLEDIYQPHNVSASIRSIECFGVQDAYIIEQQNRYAVNTGVSKGASNWVTLKRYGREGRNNTEECFSKLRANGYRIVVASPHIKDGLLSELPLNQKTAIVFGAEERGVSLYAQENADGAFTIPMYGFTESFNVSVCVSLCFYDIVNRLRVSSLPWRLSEDERLDIKLEWLRIIVRGAEFLEKEFFVE
ncbi:TPA: rRNA methyltransferase [Candidatus Dependentiae bacterium]|nr:MAG: tRNA/rRNA methyltransferase (SpoU) [candidate division TM6 bacterium GW2011_GWF2_43_87]HBL98072.1 rRNA methyltransferase [Candidatus Dependentiae bacterium]